MLGVRISSVTHQLELGEIDVPRRIKIVYQPSLRTCGPACLAMLANSNVQKIIKLLGNRYGYNKGVDKKDMQWALRKLGIYHSDNWERDGLWQMADKALLHFEYFFGPNKRVVGDRPIYGHYIVYANGKYYDPYYGVRTDLYHCSHATDWIRVRGYLIIWS